MSVVTSEPIVPEQTSGRADGRESAAEESKHRPTKADELIYQNINTYRIHADNLRWTLLGGYAAILAGGLSALGGKGISLDTIDWRISMVLAAVSWLYFVLLAVQNFFYNLFAAFATECERRLSRGEQLRTLEEFAQSQDAQRVTPFHPAFIMAEIIVSLTAFGFLYLGVGNWYVGGLSEWLHTWPNPAAVAAWWVALICYVALLNVVFFNWQRWIQPFIERWSALYRRVPSAAIIPSDQT